MARDGEDRDGRVGASLPRLRELAARGAALAVRLARGMKLGLPAKLLLLTIAFVMVAEVVIFLPTVANFRVAWLNDRLTAAALASLAAAAVPGGEIPAVLRADLLRTAQVKAVAVRNAGQRRLVLAPDAQTAIDAHYDLSQMGGAGWLKGLGSRFALIVDALRVYVSSGERTLRVTGAYGTRDGDFIEIVLPEAPLRSAMIGFGLNVLALSLIISLITAGLVYLALASLLVRPMMRITRNMVQFSQQPEDASRIIVPSGRTDEVGVAERELALMQRELAQALLQKNRLAQLGLAVSKINHDLRNMLANAQLISDRLTSLPDPTVQRFAPKLIASLDRAIAFCNSSLAFGKAEEAEPRRELARLLPIVEEVADGLGLPREGSIAWRVEVDTNLRIDADREHLFRILSNIVRNSVQALENHSRRDGGRNEIRLAARREGRKVLVEISDNGPGIPAKARAHLFRAFQGSVRRGGTGLGLAIASELAAAHGGAVRLLEDRAGAAFVIEIPDRVAR